MEEIISSEQNSKIKSLKRLYSKRQRKKKGKFLLEGYRIIDEALKSEAVFDDIYMTADFINSDQGKSIIELMQKNNNIQYPIVVQDKLLESIADTASPQGIIAVVNEDDYTLGEVFKGNKTLLLLDQIQDPGNMGTIIRTAVAAGVGGIIVLKGSVDIYNLKVLRSTMGAIFNIPLVKNTTLDDFLQSYNNIKHKYQLISTDLSAEKYYNQVEYNEPVIIAIGNEANGLRKGIIDQSDLCIKIPVIGDINSLNAAIAAGIIVYKVMEKKWI
ncbi:MAG: TrmH family RNA methyltransferase [Halanaerobiaceae bacterium]